VEGVLQAVPRGTPVGMIQRAAPTTRTVRQSPLVLPGFLLGLGVGGFVDGIVLHQLLQWHHMRTGDGALGDRSAHTVAGLEANTLGDGFFHLATLILTVIGIFILSSRLRGSEGDWSRLELVGWMLTGWGAFNFVEGVIDHQILGIHHVRDDIGAPLGWDLAFLASGLVLMALGWIIAARARDATTRTGVVST
jgi:uncharacterized membrane protein